MKLIANGINASTGEPLVEPLEEEAFATRVAESLGANSERLTSTAEITGQASTSRGELERERTPDLGDPVAAGWTFLVNGDDPQRSEIVDALRPLAELRGMPDPSSPLVFDPDEDWLDWLLDNHLGIAADDRPFYVLVAGGPDRVPLLFQSFLDVAGSAGRVAFDTIDDLDSYVRKLVRLTSAKEPATTPTAVVFAPEHGPTDATYFSRRHMAEPIIRMVEKGGVFQVTQVLGDEATKEHLMETLANARPALVYTAGHGAGDPAAGFVEQKRTNGSILCQVARPEQPLSERLFSADDVPKDHPFLEGSVFFQFACYGFGTPAESDFAHWRLGVPPVNAERDFVAALPRALLAHPHGPIGFIGHLDLAWLHAFDDPQEPQLLGDRWHPRLAPFRAAVQSLLRGQPCGYAMGDMNKRYDAMNARLTLTWDQMKRGKLELTTKVKRRLADDFLFRSDAQNYFVFGDPAAGVRVSDPPG
jgi:hypothetical protein